MEHPFFPTSTTRAEALQWLSISEKLLYSRDLFGSKTLATRARDADPTLAHADQILAVVDTLITGDLRVGNNNHDWYAILRLSPSQGRDGNLVAASYRRLASWLNPQVNRYPYADQAFRLVVDAWTVLSNPSTKVSYDREIGVFVPMQPDPFAQNPFQGMGQNQNFMFFGGAGGSSGVNFPVDGSNVSVQRLDPVGPSTQAAQSFISVQRVDPVGPSTQAAQSFISVQRVDPVGPSTQAAQSFMGVQRDPVGPSTQATQSFMGVQGVDPVGPSTQATTESFMSIQRVDPVGLSTQATQSFMGVQRVDPLGSSTQATQSFMGVGSGGTSGFGLNINMGKETECRQANHGYASSFPGNVRDEDDELRNNNGFININANVNDATSSENVNAIDGANLVDTNGDLGNTNISINSNGNVNVDESNENVDMNDTVSEHEDFARTTNTHKNTDNIDATEETIDNEDESSFWTACPYCYYMYEYPQTYIDCTLRCQNCKNAFQGVVIPSPPPTSDDQDSYFCCWGFLPLGFSVEVFESNKANISSSTPSIPVTRTKTAARKTKNTGPWVYFDDDDEASVDISDASVSSDDDWHRDKEKKTNKSTKIVRRHKVNNATMRNTRSSVKAKADKGEVQDELVVEVDAETRNNNAKKKISESSRHKKGASITPRKQPARAAKNCGKLNLNVELSNEAEDSGSGANQENRRSPDQGEDDNIEGTGFFEGLDEFLSSLPILNPAGNDKAAKGG